MVDRSSDGLPSTIHSAIALPTPPAAARPCTQKPAATKKPATSVSPSRNSPSGVNASGPCTTRAMSTSRNCGTRARAAAHDLRHPLVVGCEQGARGGQWRAVLGPARLRVAQVPADEQATGDVRAEVEELVGVAHGGGELFRGGQWGGDGVLVLASAPPGCPRRRAGRSSRPPRRPRRPPPRRATGPAVGAYAGDPAAFDGDAGDAGVGGDLDAEPGRPGHQGTDQRFRLAGSRRWAASRRGVRR